jgi:hypothetical protein
VEVANHGLQDAGEVAVAVYAGSSRSGSPVYQTSIPTIPAPPDGQAYGLGNLKMVQGYTRQGYEAAFGVQAPDFNAALPPKSWFDSTAVAGTPSTYQTVVSGADGQPPQYVSFTLPGEQAASVNLPGNRHYDVWVAPPTGATRAGYLGSQVPINPVYLATSEQAQSLAKALGGTVSEYMDGMFPLSYPANEARRYYVVVIGETQYPAGTLLRDMYQKGVGAPGHWVNEVGNPHWVSEYVPSQQLTSNVPEVSYPMRQLNPDEHFIKTGPGGMVIQVVHGVLPIEKQASGGFTDADRRVLMAIKTAVGA